MSSITSRRLSTALALSTLLLLPVHPAAAAARHPRPARPAAPTAGMLTQAWLWVTDLLGTPTASSPGRHGLNPRHDDLGGFIDPDGARLLAAQLPGTIDVTP
jgi:hypothetical protein